MEGVPFPPLTSGDPATDIDRILDHLYTLTAFLAEDRPDAGWSVTGSTELKVLSGTSTLTDVRNVLSTLIQLLTAKGVLSA